MKGLVSGQSGVAVVERDERWYVIRSTDHEPALTPFSVGMRFFDGSTDVEEVTGEDLRSVISAVVTATAKDRALQYVLVLLREETFGSLEKRIFVRLKDHLSVQGVPEFILNRLYVAALNSSSVRQVNALIASDPQHSMSLLLKDVLKDQQHIAGARSAWENIATGRFRSIQAKDEFFFSAVNRGLMRKIVQDPAGVLRETRNDAEYGELIRDWATNAASTNRGLITPPTQHTSAQPCPALGTSIIIVGEIYSREELLVDGEVDGKLELQHRLIVGPKGRVRATIKARELVIYGDVQGDVEVSDRITIKRGGSLVGDIRTAGIVIDDGAYFKGSIDIVKSPVDVATSAPPEWQKALA